MRVSMMAPGAAFLLVVTGAACDFGTITTTGEEQRSDEDSAGGGSGSGGGGGQGGEGGGGGSGSGGGGGQGGEGGSGGNGNGSGSGGRHTPPATGDEEPDTPEGGEGETTQEEGSEPIMLELGGSHRFEDGFTVTMSPVERRTEPTPERSDATGEEDPAEEAPDGDGSTDDESMEGLDETEPVEEETAEDSTDDPTAIEGESPEEEPGEEGSSDEGPPTVEDDPLDEESAEGETSEEEPVEEGSEDEGDDYYAWTIEITNGTDEQIHTGSILTDCSVGDPLRESSGPLLGEALNPPMFLAPDESGSWDEDCWAAEDDPTLRWSLEFIDEQGRSLYPALVFEGQAP